MGLDQYAIQLPRRYYKNGVTIRNAKFNADMQANVTDATREDVAYWRKNRHLHGWMENLYRKKCAFAGVEPGEFNYGDIVFLNLRDLDDLEEAIKNKSFEDAHGFFWGDGAYTDNKAENDLKFVEKARDILSDCNNAVYYTSWW